MSFFFFLSSLFAPSLRLPSRPDTSRSPLRFSFHPERYNFLPPPFPSLSLFFRPELEIYFLCLIRKIFSFHLIGDAYRLLPPRDTPSLPLSSLGAAALFRSASPLLDAPLHESSISNRTLFWGGIYSFTPLRFFLLPFIVRLL